MSVVLLTITKISDTTLDTPKQVLVDLDQCECENIIGGTKVTYYPPVANHAQCSVPETKSWEVSESVFELRDAACCGNQTDLPGVSTSLP